MAQLLAKAKDFAEISHGKKDLIFFAILGGVGYSASNMFRLNSFDWRFHKTLLVTGKGNVYIFCLAKPQRQYMTWNTHNKMYK